MDSILIEHRKELTRVNTLSQTNARRLRADRPFHLPPGAQPMRSRVELVLEGVDTLNITPIIVLTDTRRDYEWRVAMTQNEGRWRATVMMPSETTIVTYHFLVGEEKILEYRQLEGRNKAIYGEWTELDFKIAIYDPAGMPADWTKGLLIYQIFPDRFANSDPDRPLSHGGVYGKEALFLPWGETPEAPPTGRDFFGGDLRGIIQHLDYLKALEIECVYLTPIFEAATNHRYEAINFMKIDPMLGTEQDFDDLVREVHARGMTIILDAVFNHCSSDSVYFDITGKQSALTGVPGAAQSQDSPYYRWFKFKEWPTDYDGWWGYGFMPEFVECPEMEEFFLGENGVTRHWLRRGIDGWRCDVAFDNTDIFWRRFRRAVEAEKPGAYTISEEWRDSTHYLLGDMYNATMNYRFTWAARGFLATHDLLPSTLDDRLQTWLRDTPPDAIYSQMNLLDSHDTDRLLTLCKGDRQRYLQTIAFQLSYPGAPCIYYGNETGLEGAYAEDGRRCMPWDHLDQDLIDRFQQMIHARQQSRALRVGRVETCVIDDDQRTYGFIRQVDHETVYALFNAGDQPATVRIALASDTSSTFRDLLGLNPQISAESGYLTVTLPALGMAWYHTQ
ncbi:MAG: glycoside hydrolase family 13 protein [Anaerolineae bacterium]|jgi:glycosidase|nr:glycoside hydrolase family 13 protein [Anaerolineae bacterium]